MNRLVWDGETRISVHDLPPERRVDGGPARVLFVHGRELGFGTTARTLQGFCAERGDIDAVHVSPALPGWARAVGKELPKWLRGADFHNTRMTWAFGKSVERLVREHLPLERFDVVHIMTRERATLVCAPWVRALGEKRPRMVVNVDATLAAWDRAFEVRRVASGVDYGTDLRILRVADSVACASRWVMDSVVGDYGVDARKCVLHMPCVVREAEAGVREPGARVREGSRPLRLVFIGNDFVRKGGDRLLKWHQQGWAQRAELHICSAGAPGLHTLERAGREEGRLESDGSSATQAAKKHRRDACATQTGENVTLYGRVEHGRLVREVLPSMDVCVIPTWEDTFLIAAQEAQMAGLPVVTSRLAGIPEVVADGETGTLCARGDDAAFIAAVEAYMDDPGLLARQSAAAAARAGPGGALDARVWHGHLLDQLVALADKRSPVCAPPGLDGARTAGGVSPA